MMLQPDGRIYIVPFGNSSVRYLHYIAYPNRAGAACEVRQHSIRTPVTISNVLSPFPNYRLGPLDGSPCDTLGLDNHPLAHFRYDVPDTAAAPLTVQFTDLSAYEPAAWSWAFGDPGGGMSADTSPVYTFPAPGTYPVCLTVSNANGTNTTCRDVTVGLTSSTAAPPAAPAALTVWPNPTPGPLTVAYAPGFPTGARLEVYDALGRARATHTPAAGQREYRLDAGGLAPGMYVVRLRAPGEAVADGRFWVYR